MQENTEQSERLVKLFYTNATTYLIGIVPLLVKNISLVFKHRKYGNFQLVKVSCHLHCDQLTIKTIFLLYILTLTQIRPLDDRAGAGQSERHAKP